MQGVEWGTSLPPVLLLHGTSDTCALVSNATQFSQALDEAGAQVSCCLSSPSIFGRTSIVLGSAQRLYVGQNCTISLLGLGGHSYAILDESRTVQRHRPSAAQVEEGSVVCHHAKTSGLSRCAQSFWHVLAAHIDTVPFVHWWTAETPGEHDRIVEEW